MSLVFFSPLYLSYKTRADWSEKNSAFCFLLGSLLPNMLQHFCEEKKKLYHRFSLTTKSICVRADNTRCATVTPAVTGLFFVYASWCHLYLLFAQRRLSDSFVWNQTLLVCKLQEPQFSQTKACLRCERCALDPLPAWACLWVCLTKLLWHARMWCPHGLFYCCVAAIASPLFLHWVCLCYRPSVIISTWFLPFIRGRKRDFFADNFSGHIEKNRWYAESLDKAPLSCAALTWLPK